MQAYPAQFVFIGRNVETCSNKSKKPLFTTLSSSMSEDRKASFYKHLGGIARLLSSKLCCASSPAQRRLTSQVKACVLTSVPFHLGAMPTYLEVKTLPDGLWCRCRCRKPTTYRLFCCSTSTLKSFKSSRDCFSIAMKISSKNLER
jgi:hypothetical protein